MKIDHKTIIILMFLLSITACGQKGPLYLPGEKTPYGPPYYSIIHSTNHALKKDQHTTLPHHEKI